MRHLLDQILDAAPDLDTALDLAERLGWKVNVINGPSREGGSRFWVHLEGPARPTVLHPWYQPEVRVQARYANASFKSLYGAILIALLRGLVNEREADAECADFLVKHERVEVAA